MRWVTGTTAVLTAESPPGESWVDYVYGMAWDATPEQPAGQLAWGIVLGHTPENHQGEISVCTVDRAAFAEFCMHSARGTLVDLA